MGAEELYATAYDAYFREKEPERAAALFREVIEKFPDSHEARYAKDILSTIRTEAAEVDLPSLILQHLNASTVQRSTYKKMGILLLSLAMFIMAGVIGWNAHTLLAIAIGIFIHEFGHLLAMRLTGYRDLQILFIPLLGGAAVGTSTKADASDDALVSLAGPLFGLLSAVFSGVIFQSTRIQFFATYTEVAVVINVLNLLPIYPFDGGRFFDTLLFGKFPRLGTGFRILGVVALFAAAVAFKDALLFVIGILFAAPLLRSVAVGKAAQSYRQRFGERHVPDTESVSFILQGLKKEMPAVTESNISKHIVPMVRDILMRARMRHATWRQTLTLIFAYLFILIPLPIFALTRVVI